MTPVSRLLPVSPAISAALQGLDGRIAIPGARTQAISAYAQTRPSLASTIPQNRGALALAAERSPVSSLPADTAGIDLEAALASVNPETISKNLHWIADDTRGGRGTPSAGQTQTAKFLSTELEKFGWAPAGGPGTYLYHYKTWGGFFKTEPTETHGLDGTPIKDDNVTTFSLSGNGAKQDFKFGEDYFYSSLGQKCDCEITGELVSAGFGLPQEFSGANARGKWVVVFDNPLVSPDERRARAKEAGAKGLIVLPNPIQEDKQHDQRVRDRARLAAEGRMQYPIDSDFDEITFTREGAVRFTPLFEDAAGASDAESLLAPRATTGLTFQDKRVLSAPFGQIEADNVAGFWKGSDPELSKEVILITAHYDHLGTSRGGKIFNGADDNGSGTASLLALAEAIAKMNPRRSVMIMWVSGEELGLLGSAAWVRNPYFPEGVKPVLDINMDMVGRNDDDHELFITPSPRHREYNGVVKTFEARATEEGFAELGSADQYYTRSDHYEYRKLGIPVAFITTGMHDDYHQPSDDPDKIDYSKMARNIRLVLRVLADLQADGLPK